MTWLRGGQSEGVIKAEHFARNHRGCGSQWAAAAFDELDEPLRRHLRRAHGQQTAGIGELQMCRRFPCGKRTFCHPLAVAQRPHHLVTVPCILVVRSNGRSTDWAGASFYSLPPCCEIFIPLRMAPVLVTLSSVYKCTGLTVQSAVGLGGEHQLCVAGRFTDKYHLGVVRN